MTRPLPSWFVVLVAPMMLACDREPRPPAVDSTPAPTPASSDTPRADGARSGWEGGYGPVLLVAGTQREASVVFPNFSDSTLTDTTTFDTSIVSDMRVDLFSRGGLVGHGRVRSTPSRPRNDGCVAWPEAAVMVTDSSGTSSAWTVAFAAGRATPVALDSLEVITGADSARLTAEVARLASLAPNDTASAFQGIPYFVRQVRRFRTGDTHVLIANVTRRINQEANPREEQVLLIAERQGTQPDARYTLTYHERVSGHEEAIESTDVLAVVALAPSGTPAIVLIRDYGDGTAYALIARAPGGDWRLAWNSAYAGC